MMTDDTERLFKAVHPNAHYARFLERGVQPDGRRPDQTRHTLVALNCLSGEALAGSAMGSVGATSVVCGVRCEVVTPTKTRPKAGRISIYVSYPESLSKDTLTTANPPTVIVPSDTHLAFESTTTSSSSSSSPEAVYVESVLKNLIESTRLVNLDDLCIAEGRCAWHLCVEAYCLDDAGSSVDAFILATVGALRNVRLPFVLVTPENEVRLLSRERSNVPLKLGASAVIPLTFSRFRSVLVADPDREEERVGEAGRCTVAVIRRGGGTSAARDRHDDDAPLECLVLHASGEPLALDTLERAFELCAARKYLEKT